MADLLISPADALPDFLRQAAREPFAFGEWDCAMTLANWVRAVTGRDPAPDLRGAYTGEYGWRRRVILAGGLQRLIGEIAERAGMTKAIQVRPGDIAAVETAIGVAGAIRSGDGWVVKSGRGLTSAPFPALGCWTF